MNFLIVKVRYQLVPRRAASARSTPEAAHHPRCARAGNSRTREAQRPTGPMDRQLVIHVDETRAGEHDEWECTHYGPEGEIVRVEKCNGDTRYFEGSPRQEALRRRVLYNAEQHDSAHVVEWYEGPHGNVRLVRAMCRNGDIVFYKGDSPDNMRKDRRWTLYGFIDYYTGEKGREYLTGELGLQPRFSPGKDDLNNHIDWVKGIRVALEKKRLQTCPFDIGTRVTLQGQRWANLDGRLGVIDGWSEQEQRCLVRLEDGLVLSVKVERLLLSKEHCVAAWRRLTSWLSPKARSTTVTLSASTRIQVFVHHQGGAE